MVNRFISYVLTAASELPDSVSISNEIAKLFPANSPDLKFHEDATDNTSLVFSVHQANYALILVDRPLPPDAYEQALKLNRSWPDAPNAVSRHRSHIIVTALSEAESHKDALVRACIISMAIAAIVSLTTSEAVVWSNGDTINEGSVFKTGALGINQNQLPVDQWISFNWLDGPLTNEGKRTFAALTTGLKEFVGRELEWLPTALSPVTIAERLIGTCQYLIANGPVIKDNETLGISETEHIRARFADRGMRPGIPVIKLSVENIDLPPPPSKPSGVARAFGFGKRGLN
jgi:hypothetical protein